MGEPLELPRIRGFNIDPSYQSSYQKNTCQKDTQFTEMAGFPLPCQLGRALAAKISLEWHGLGVSGGSSANSPWLVLGLGPTEPLSKLMGSG